MVREWLLITRRGAEATKQEGGGGGSEVLPLQKGGSEKALAMPKRGQNKF